MQVSTNFLSTRPVLQCLQGMPSVPMAQELVHGQHPEPTTYLDMPAVEQVRGRHAVGFASNNVYMFSLVRSLHAALLKVGAGLVAA
jgi:hypothetical protein